MSLSKQESYYMDQADNLSVSEKERLDDCMAFIRKRADQYGVPLAGDDRCAKAESALIRWIIDSQEPVAPRKCFIQARTGLAIAPDRSHAPA